MWLAQIQAMLPSMGWVIDLVRGLCEFSIIFVMIYCVLYFLRGTRAISVLTGIVIILLVATALAGILKLEVIGWLLANLWTMFATAMIVIFQPELRRAFAQIGSRLHVHKSTRQIEAIEEVVSAVTQMSFRRTGALIVFERQIGMAAIINSAVVLDTKINSLLLQSIFYPNSPLHDGAVIIKDATIAAAHAILPLTQEGDPATKNLGTRHRAAIGVTEETDALAVVVSEETGTVSVAYKGRLKRNLSEFELLSLLNEMLLDNSKPSVGAVGEIFEEDPSFSAENSNGNSGADSNGSK